MKKHLAQQLNAIAETIPHVFIEHEDSVSMSGKDLLLTPLADKVDDVNAMYSVFIPKYIAVDHKQQVKDAYKREGWQGVTNYMFSVLKSLGFSDEEIQAIYLSKKQEVLN